jgi:hypothetical protein
MDRTIHKVVIVVTGVRRVLLRAIYHNPMGVGYSQEVDPSTL